MPLSMGEASITTYADDSMVYYAAHTCSELNHSIWSWIKANKLTLNPSKTVSIFGSKRKIALDPKLSLTLDGHPIQQVMKTKLLELQLDNTLSSIDHVNSIVCKMGVAIATARKCASFLPPAMLNQIVCSFLLTWIIVLGCGQQAQRDLSCRLLKIRVWNQSGQQRADGPAPA